MAFPAVLFDGEYAVFGVGVKVPVGGCRTDVEECGKFFLGDTGVFVEGTEEFAGFFAGEEEENRLFKEGVRGRFRGGVSGFCRFFQADAGGSRRSRGSSGRCR